MIIIIRIIIISLLLLLFYYYYSYYYYFFYYKLVNFHDLGWLLLYQRMFNTFRILIHIQYTKREADMLIIQCPERDQHMENICEYCCCLSMATNNSFHPRML